MPLPASTTVLRRVITSVALLGVLVVVHLGLQKQAHNFAFGCSGLAGGGGTSGCAEVTSSAYADFLGVSNIVWGLLFYGLLVVLRLAYVATADDRVRLAAFAQTGVGALYTGWLVYLQVARIGSFCALCMTSAVLVLTLLILHVLEHRRLGRAVTASPRRASAPERRGLAALRPYTPIVGLFLVLLVADVALAGRSSTDDAEGPAPDITAVADPSVGVPAAQAVDQTTCGYNDDIPPITDLSPFTTGPYKGTEGAPVTVVEIFDPNCPHCKEMQEVMEPVIASTAERARFFYIPFPLNDNSVGQTVALKMAQRDGKFFELMNEMFARQDQTWGMSLPELVATLNAVGMNGAAFETMVQDQAQLKPFLDQVQAESEAVRASFASSDGGISVPRIAIDGRVVASTYASMNQDCITSLIEQAATPTASE